MNYWHEVSVKFIKEYTDGTLKRVTEKHLVSALSFTDAEARIYKEVGEYIRGEFQVNAIKTINLSDVFHYEDAETWYQTKVASVVEDADSGKEKKYSSSYLVSAHNIKEAYERIEESLKGLMFTYEISEIKQSKIVEVFPYEPTEEEKQKSAGKNVAYTMDQDED